MLILILNEAVFSFEKGSNGQNHSCSFSHHPVKKFSLLVKYMISCPSGGMPTYPRTPPSVSTIWKALIYKVVVAGSLVPAMGNRTSCAQVHELAQSHFSNKQVEAHFVKNGHIALLHTDYHIIIIYIIDLFSSFIYIYIFNILFLTYI